MLARAPNFDDTEIAFRARTTLALRKAKLLFSAFHYPMLVSLGPKLVTAALRLRLPVTPVIKATIFELFCGGETVEDCEASVTALARHKVGAILDYSVEGLGREEDFDATRDEVLHLIRHAEGDRRFPFSVFKMTGVGRFDLLAKVQAGALLTAAEAAEFDRVKARVDAMCGEAAKRGVRILIDAEETWIQDPIDALALAMIERYNRGGTAVVFNTVQLYRVDRLAYLKGFLAQCEERGAICAVKLVRGAYMEKERAYADQAGKPSPIQPDKASTDRDFDAALAFCVDHLGKLEVMAGSHNETSNRLLCDLMRKHKLEAGDARIHFAQLLGMSDNLTYNLAHHGYNVAKYVPYGPVRAALPYLFRRANENSSIQGQTGRELTLIDRELVRRGKS